MEKIKLVCFDFDGVFTNGQVNIDKDGIIQKSYNIKDGMGIKLLKNKKIKTVVLSGFKNNESTIEICKHIGIDKFKLDCHDKLNDLLEILKEFDLELNNVAYIGDDINDCELISNVGFSACPKDAHKKCINNVNYVCNKVGGHGCVREFIDKILEKKNELQILDCTLRDGGIVNNWEFSNDFINNCIKSLNSTNIDYMELGYIADKKHKNFLGSVDISSLNKTYDFNNCNIKFSVMGDYGKFSLNLIPDKNENENPISLIRVAGPIKMLDNIEEIINDIKNKGYEISINIMNSSRLTNEQFNIIVENINKLKTKPDFLYFADSFGSLYPNEVKKIINKLQEIKNVKLGFHAHNNLQLAFTNCMSAIDSNISIVDSTICGMGKCAGNLPTELFLMYQINKLNNTKYNINKLLDFIDDKFKYLKNNYEWGYTQKYLITGMYNSSSRFGQYLMNEHTDSKLNNILDIIENTPNDKRTGFTKPNLKVCCIIPARFGSSRLKGKPIIKINGISVITRTCMKAKECKMIDQIYVTTDNDLIEQEVKSNGFDVIRVDEDCLNGTERVYKAYLKLSEKFDVIVNIQGDESFCVSEDIDKQIQFHINNNSYCTCLHTNCKSSSDLIDPNMVKLVLNNKNEISYLSRNVIPAVKDDKIIKNINDYLIHLGVYVFSPESLKDFFSLEVCKNQLYEDIEILKFIDNSKKIYSYFVEKSYIQINTVQDIDKLSKIYTIEH